jgi:hypothetical protein
MTRNALTAVCRLAVGLNADAAGVRTLFERIAGDREAGDVQLLRDLLVEIGAQAVLAAALETRP